MSIDDDFVKTLVSSQAPVQLPSEVLEQFPDFLSGAAPQNPLLSQVASDDTERIPGAKEYGFTFHSERLVIGKLSDGYDQGKEIFTDVDESEKLKEIMDKHLQGKALIHCKKETFLKDGTVVIWIEWLEAKKEIPTTARNFLSEEELLSPEHVSDDPENGDDSETLF